MKKNLFFTFCFSFIPGAGQMYQEYMKRGLSILITFAGFIALAVILGTPIFFIPTPIIWIYSFFDTYHIRNNVGTEKEQKDEYLWGNDDMSSSFNKILEKKSYLIGIGLLLLGIYLFCNNLLYTISVDNNIQWLRQFVEIVRQYLPTLIISALSIGIGIKLMFNKNK